MSKSNYYKNLRFYKKIRHWAKRLKQELKALNIALTENLVPWYVKVLIVVTIGYALSPIDLIPDFIPVLGQLDDIIIIPLLIALIVKIIPEETMVYCRKQAEIKKIQLKKNWPFAVIIAVFWTLIGFWLYNRLK